MLSLYPQRVSQSDHSTRPITGGNADPDSQYYTYNTYLLVPCTASQRHVLHNNSPCQKYHDYALFVTLLYCDGLLMTKSYLKR